MVDKLTVLKNKCEYKNKQIGFLDELDCPNCLNKGFILVVDSNTETINSKQCSCMLHRRNKRDIRKQGLTHLFEEFTFDNFKTDEQWQKKMKDRALKYAKNPSGWLLITGQIGGGKTLVGVSVLNDLMSQGYRCKFVGWQTLMSKLKNNVNEQEYFDILDEYSNVEVLFIDDLFKGGYKNTPTDSDVRLTQIIIDKRYINNLKTIISSESLTDDMLEISESIASRIIEKSRGNKIQIIKDKERNYRLKTNDV